MDDAHDFFDGGRSLLALGDAYTSPIGKSALGWEVMILLVSGALFTFYSNERYRGRGAEWEVLYIAVVESVIYVLHIMYPEEPGAVIQMKEGPKINWLRYAGWLVTTPILIIHMQSLSGVAKLDDRLVQMLICNQAMILFGVTGAISNDANRGVAFTLGCIAMFVVFYRAGEIYSKAFKTYPKAAKSWLLFSMLNFYIPWSSFPLLWLFGPEAGGQMGIGEDVIAHCIADLSAKMAWGYISWYLHHVILRDVADRYGLTSEEYCSARSFDVQFGHDSEWTAEDPDSPSEFALDTVLTRRELEETLEELNHGRLKPSMRKAREKHDPKKGLSRRSLSSEVSNSIYDSRNIGDADLDANDLHVSIDMNRQRSRSDIVAHALANGGNSTMNSRHASPMPSPHRSPRSTHNFDHQAEQWNGAYESSAHENGARRASFQRSRSVGYSNGNGYSNGAPASNGAPNERYRMQDELEEKTKELTIMLAELKQQQQAQLHSERRN